MKHLFVHIPIVKSFWLFAFILTGVSYSSAQPFGEAGTKWEHCFLFDWEIPATFYELDVRSINTYDVDTLSCSTLVIDDIYGFTSRDTMTACSIGDRVYYVEYDSLVLLYDFSLQAGDTLIVKVPETMYEYMAELCHRALPASGRYHRFLTASGLPAEGMVCPFASPPIGLIRCHRVLPAG
jgi:hypothetical protein